MYSISYCIWFCILYHVMQQSTLYHIWYNVAYYNITYDIVSYYIKYDIICSIVVYYHSSSSQTCCSSCKAGCWMNSSIIYCLFSHLLCPSSYRWCCSFAKRQAARASVTVFTSQAAMADSDPGYHKSRATRISFHNKLPVLRYKMCTSIWRTRIWYSMSRSRSRSTVTVTYSGGYVYGTYDIALNVQYRVLMYNIVPTKF
jgi:hypothetical protein